MKRFLCKHRMFECSGVPDIVAVPLQHPMLAFVDKACDQSTRIPQRRREMQEPMELWGHVIFPVSGDVRVQEEFDCALKLLRRDFAARDGRNEVDHVTQCVVSTTLCGTYGAEHLEEQCDDHV